MLLNKETKTNQKFGSFFLSYINIMNYGVFKNISLLINNILFLRWKISLKKLFITQAQM